MADEQLEAMAASGRLSPDDPKVIEAVRRGLIRISAFRAPKVEGRVTFRDRTDELRQRQADLKRPVEPLSGAAVAEDQRRNPLPVSGLQEGAEAAVMSTAGGLAGAAIGGPVGMIAGGAAGAGAARLAHGGTAAEAGKDAAIDAAWSMALPVVGSGVRRVVGGVRQGVRRLLPGGREAFDAVREAAEEAAQLGIPVRHGTLTPGTVAESGALKNTERIVSAMWGGAPLRETAEEGAELLRGTITRRIGPSVAAAEALDDAPLAVQKAAQGVYRQWLDEAGELYRKVDQAAQTELVDLAPIELMAKEILEGPAKLGSKKARAKAAGQLRELLERGNTTTFEDAHALRSDLLEFIVEQQRMGHKGGLIPHLKRVQTALDAQIDGSLATPELKSTLALARSKWHTAKEVFERGPLRGLIKAAPERAIKIVSGTRSPKIVDEMRAVLDPEDFEVFRGSVIDDVLTKAGAKTGEEIPFGFGKALAKNKGLIESLYPDEGARILRSAEALDFLSKRLRTSPARGVERDAILLAQGFLAHMNPASLVGTAAAPFIARLLSSKNVAFALVNGSLQKPGTPAFSKWIQEIYKAAEQAVPGTTAAILSQTPNEEPEAARAAGGSR